MKFTTAFSLLFATLSLLDAFTLNGPSKASMSTFSTILGRSECFDSSLPSMDPRLVPQSRQYTGQDVSLCQKWGYTLI